MTFIVRETTEQLFSTCIQLRGPDVRKWFRI